MTDLNPNITKITLTINGLNTPIKENHQNIFFNNLHICSLQETHLKCTNNIDWKQRDEKKKRKIRPENTNQRKLHGYTNTR